MTEKKVQEMKSDLDFYKNAYEQLRTRCSIEATKYFDKREYCLLAIRPTREKPDSKKIQELEEKLSGYETAFKELRQRCTPEAMEYFGRNLFGNIIIHANHEQFLEIPKEPIKVADWLIDRGLKSGIRLYGKNELNQIAKHLLIYCEDEKCK